jgi:L-alanine-DL-glutamate epimerase-like enolase superfamily enzyme
MPSLWQSLADLDVRIDDYSVQRRELAVSPEFTRVTTTVLLHSGELVGQGEDVTYTASDHKRFPVHEMLAGTWTLHEYSRRLEELDLWPDAPPEMEASVDYRRWAFESAALDLALQQAGRSFAEAVGREYRPVRFVASTRADIAAYRELNPDLEFKLDADEGWDAALLDRLAASDRVRVVDFKAYYRGTSVDLAPDPELYRRVKDALPDAVLEDAWLEDGCREALAGAEDRLSFDAPIHSWADVKKLPLEPRWLNIKPSRFGTIRTLLECIEECEQRGIRMYGGGQFELGAGRRQIQKLASVFYPDTPNDVAPGEYNEGPPHPGLPTSPLPAFEGPGF